MAAESSYNAFIAQLERKHKEEPQGRDSYVDVFNQAARVVGHLKKGLNVSIQRERQSEIRVAAQSWQDAAYNNYPGSGVDILDWQPRFAQPDPAASTSASGPGAQTGGSLSGQHPSKSAVAGSGAGVAGGIAAPRVASPATGASRRRSTSTSSPPHRKPAPLGPGAGGAGADGGGLVTHPHPPAQPPPGADGPGSSRPGMSRPHALSTIGTGASSSPPSKPGKPAPGDASASITCAATSPKGSCPSLSGAVGRSSPGPARPAAGRRANTDTVLTQSRNEAGGKPLKGGLTDAPSPSPGRGRDSSGPGDVPREEEPPRRGWRSGILGPGAPGGGLGISVDQLPPLPERSSVGGCVSPRPQLREESSSTSLSSQLPQVAVPNPVKAVKSGSLADEAIRLFAQAAYEPGEYRPSLLSNALAPGTSRGQVELGPMDSHPPAHLQPLAPVPRAVPRHVAEALSSLTSGGSGSSASFTCGSPRSAHSLTALGSGGGANVEGGHDGLRTWQSPPSFLQPRPPDEPAAANGSSANLRPAALRGRLAPSSYSAPSTCGKDSPVPAPLAAASGGSIVLPRSLVPLPAGDGESPKRVQRAGRRRSLAEYMGPDSPSRGGALGQVSGAFAGAAAEAAVAAAGGGGGDPSPPSGLRKRHSISGLPPALGPAGVRTGSVTYGGGGSSSNSPGKLLVGKLASLSGDIACGPSGAGGGSTSTGGGSGLIRGYIGGGALDHRLLDAVPRLGLDRPRIRGVGPGSESDTPSPIALDHQSFDDAGGASASPGRFARARRNSCCLPSAALMSPGGGGAGAAVERSAASAMFARPGGGIPGASGGSMLVTREQIDSYILSQAVLAKAWGTTGAGGSPRVVNVIGMRGCLTEAPASPGAGQRALQREVGSTDASTMRQRLV